MRCPINDHLETLGAVWDLVRFNYAIDVLFEMILFFFSTCILLTRYTKHGSRTQPLGLLPPSLKTNMAVVLYGDCSMWHLSGWLHHATPFLQKMYTLV